MRTLVLSLVLAAACHPDNPPEPGDDAGPRAETGGAASGGSSGAGGAGGTGGGSADAGDAGPTPNPTTGNGGSSGAGGSAGAGGSVSGDADAGDAGVTCPVGYRREDIFVGSVLVGRCRKACLPIEITRAAAYEGCDPSSLACTVDSDCPFSSQQPICIAGFCVPACHAPDPAVPCTGPINGGAFCSWFVDGAPVPNPTAGDCSEPSGGYWCSSVAASDVVCGL